MKFTKLLQKLIKPIVLILSSVIFFLLGYKQISLLIVIIYLIDNFYELNNYWKKEDDMNQLTKNINKTIEKNVASTLLPIVLIDKEGSIKWHNDIFNELKPSKSFIGENILSIARELNLNNIIKAEYDLHQRLKLNGRLYDVYSTKIFRNKEELYLVYFNDISEFIGLDTTKESIMLIEIDNFTEALDTTDDVDKPLVIAEIDRQINSYAYG